MSLRLATPLAAPAPAPATAPEPYECVTPLAPGRYGVQFTFGQAAHDKLRRAQELRGHAVSEGALEAMPWLRQRLPDTSAPA